MWVKSMIVSHDTTSVTVCLAALLCAVMTEMLALVANLWGATLTATAECGLNENKGVIGPALFFI